MTAVLGHSFRMISTSWKSQDLIYEKPGRKLIVYLEMSGVGQFDWVGCDTEFQKWTEPAGEAISRDEQTEILRHLAEWSRQQSIRINVCPPMDVEEMFRNYERKGWKVEHKDDGTTLITPPARPSFISRLLNAIGKRSDAT